MNPVHICDFQSAPFDIIDGDRGKNYPKRDEFFCSEHCLFLNASNVTQKGFDFSDCQFITKEKDIDLRKGKLQRGDVVLTTRGTLGNTAYYNNSVPYDHVRINSGMVIFRCNTEKILPSYLFHFLRSPSFFAQVNSLRSGAAQPQLPIRDIKSIKLPLPELPIQRRIVYILSTYDDLIENNLRRIKILETMAQDLYREWFVKFRFPGHESVRFVDSPLGKSPEGWEVSTLGEHLIALESGKRPKGGVKGNLHGIPSVGAENVRGIGRHDFKNEKLVPSEFFEQMRKGVAKNGDVALYKDGAYIGRSTYFRDGFPHTKFCVNEHVFLLRSNGRQVNQNFLYLWLQEPSTVSAIRSTNANAAQPGINQKGVRGLPILSPPSKILPQFDRLVEPNIALIISLAKRNQNLRRTRDLLLPRLISGDMDVSELDISVPEGVES